MLAQFLNILLIESVATVLLVKVKLYFLLTFWGKKRQTIIYSIFLKQYLCYETQP